MIFDKYAVHFELGGLLLAAIGLTWLIGATARRLVARQISGEPRKALRLGPWPALVVLAGLIVAALPPVYSRWAGVDLGPREKVVDGKREITLTGWDRSDYSFLRSKTDLVVLQMANPDVTDETLKSLAGLDRLEILDIHDTQVTDRGLTILKALPALSTLYLKNTKITDQGFRDNLAAKESLVRLDLTGSGVSRASCDLWLKAKKGRRVLR